MDNINSNIINTAKLRYAATQVEEVLYGLTDFGYASIVEVINDTIKITVFSPKNSDVMPTIAIEPEIDDYRLYLNPALKFPDLIQTDKNDCDTLRYYLDRWANMGSIITDIVTFVFDFKKWEFDEENDEWCYINS